MNVVASYATLVNGVRTALLYLGAMFAIVCAVDWVVRTRRISPFSRVARFFRTNVDPLFAPIERVIVRAGGVPTAAAWWGFVAYIVFAILFISLLQFLGDILLQTMFMAQNPSEAWRVIVHWIFSILMLALIVRVLSSWFSISPFSRWIRWSYLLTDWMVVPLQRVMPRLGPFDITPIVVWLILTLAEKVILS